MKPWLDDGDVQLYHGDALEVLPTIGLVDAIVTSPPYADQRKSYGGSSPDDYGEWLEPFLAAMLPVLQPTGSLMLNLGRVHRDGEEQACAIDALYHARRLGWKWLDTLIWHKPNGFIAANTRYLHSAHEYVWWLAPTVDAYRGYDADTRTPHSEVTLARFTHGFRKSTSKADTRYHKAGKRIAAPNPEGARPKSVATFAVSTHRGIAHPAPMPIDVARHLISLSCPPAGTVLDPFAGSGTTLVAARERGRFGIGIDLRADYLSEAARRLGQQTLLPGSPALAPAGDVS